MVGWRMKWMSIEHFHECLELGEAAFGLFKRGVLGRAAPILWQNERLPYIFDAHFNQRIKVVWILCMYAIYRRFHELYQTVCATYLAFCIAAVSK